MSVFSWNEAVGQKQKASVRLQAEGGGVFFSQGGGLLSFANLFSSAASLKVDGTYKAPAPSPSVPRLPPDAPPDLTGIPGQQGALPMTTFTPPP